MQRSPHRCVHVSRHLYIKLKGLKKQQQQQQRQQQPCTLKFFSNEVNLLAFFLARSTSNSSRHLGEEAGIHTYTHTHTWQSI